MGSYERLKLVLSKVAPLEAWSSSFSNFGPKVCWKFFRPDPKLSEELVRIVQSFQGHAPWIITAGDCLEPLGTADFHPEGGPALSVSSPAFVPSTLKADEADRDLLALAEAIEENLHLTNLQPQVFSESLLTKEGLGRTPGPFQDFADGGDRTAYLVTDPGGSEHFEPSEGDILLHFAPLDDELSAILVEILGSDFTQGHGRALTDAEEGTIKARFPTLWEVSDYYADSYLGPKQAELLYRECSRLANTASSLKALRGLDKLMRIGRWASEKQYGVLFSAP